LAGNHAPSARIQDLMAIEYRLVDGAGFAAEAGALLQAAWKPPALHYSPKYLHWQLSFPGPRPAPAIAALDGSKPVGFAASTHRRVRFHPANVDVAVVSFVAVHPDSRNQGVAAGLYAHLLEAIRANDLPVITFGQSGSVGQRAIERAYPHAGFQLRPFGSYPVYGCLVRPGAPALGWTPCSPGTESEALRSALSCCASENPGSAGALVWSDPSEAQIRHYRTDPRGRKLLVERDDTGALTGAAWAVRTEHVGPAGIGFVTTIDCVWVRRGWVSFLPGLAAAAAELWPGNRAETRTAQAQTVTAPNLLGFDTHEMRRFGFRQIAAGFEGYAACANLSNLFADAAGTNLEVV
jgi:GNAT superfamily N-acetyltransferase